MDLRELAEYIQNKLMDAGFIIHRYDAYSTNSIYLKLDYGVSNSIRISDHKGKKHLNYRHNIGTNLDKYMIDNSGKFPRIYYPAKLADKLIDTVISERERKIKQYGIDKYRYYMSINASKSTEEPGFWEQAKLVRRGIVAKED